MSTNNTVNKILMKGSSRRKALLTTLGISSAALWQKPVVNSVLTPAHAQTSSCPERTAQTTVNNVAVPAETSVDINIVIPDVQQDCMFTPSVTNVTLDLDISHTFIGDISATLTSPDGNTQALFGDVCSAGNSMLVTLDDNAATVIPNGVAAGDPGCPAPNGLVSGIFSTGGALSSFNGETPDGLWVLTVTDVVFIDGGVVNSATLYVTSA